MRRMLIVAASAAALAGAGCSALGRQAFQQPVVSLKDVRVQGIGVTGGNLDVLLNVYNPNGYRLDATRMTYKVAVDTVTFATGTVDDHVTMQEKDSTVVHIPVTFSYRGLGEAGRQIMGTGAVNYTVSGDVTVATPVGNYTIPYVSRGRYSTLGGVSR